MPQFLKDAFMKKILLFLWFFSDFSFPSSPPQQMKHPTLGGLHLLPPISLHLLHPELPPSLESPSEIIKVLLPWILEFCSSLRYLWLDPFPWHHLSISVILHHVDLYSDLLPARSVTSRSLEPHGLLAGQVSLSMGFSRKEYWNELPCPSAGDIPDPGIKPTSLMPTVLAGSLPLASPGKPKSKWPPHNGMWLTKSYYIPAVKHPQVLTVLETHRQRGPGVPGSQTFGLSWGLVEVWRERDLSYIMKSVVRRENHRFLRKYRQEN